MYRGMFESQKVRRHDKFRKEWSGIRTLGDIGKIAKFSQ